MPARKLLRDFYSILSLVRVCLLSSIPFFSESRDGTIFETWDLSSLMKITSMILRATDSDLFLTLRLVFVIWFWLFVWMMKCTGLRAVKFAAFWWRCTCLESIVWHAYQFSSHRYYFFQNESVKKAILYQDLGSISLPSSWFCLFGCSQINEEEKLVGLPSLQWVIRLPIFPYYISFLKPKFG